MNFTDTNINKNINSLNSKILDILEIYNTIDILQNIDTNTDTNTDLGELKFSQEHQSLIDTISERIFDQDLALLYTYYNKIKTKISNCLINQILSNSPKSDITITKFPNIKTQLHPYQINNLNWMIGIEKRNYSEEYHKISSKCIIRGGGLFDEVGMGKTLQMITLINLNGSNDINIVKNNKIYSKATLIIVPNHLCGQWAREFDIHTIKPLKIINLLTKNHYYKYTYYDFALADVVIVNANFFINCKLDQHEYSNPLRVLNDIFNKNVNIFNIYWYRVVIDEFHEIETSNLFVRLKYLESDYRWIISGTPFKENTIFNHTQIDKTSLSEILDYLTWDLNMINKVNIFEACPK